MAKFTAITVEDEADCCAASSGRRLRLSSDSAYHYLSRWGGPPAFNRHDLDDALSMDQSVSHPLTLAQISVGASALITEIQGGRELHRKLSGLGIRVGTRVRVEHRRGTGLVVSAGSTRIALGGGIVDKLYVDGLDQQQGQ